MGNELRELHKQAQHFMQSIRNEATRTGKLSLQIADNFYCLQRIKIATIYRKSTRDLSGEDRKIIEEIRLMFDEAAKIKNELLTKSPAM